MAFEFHLGRIHKQKKWDYNLQFTPSLWSRYRNDSETHWQTPKQMEVLWRTLKTDFELPASFRGSCMWYFCLQVPMDVEITATNLHYGLPFDFSRGQFSGKGLHAFWRVSFSNNGFDLSSICHSFPNNHIYIQWEADWLLFWSFGGSLFADGQRKPRLPFLPGGCFHEGQRLELPRWLTPMSCCSLVCWYQIWPSAYIVWKVDGFQMIMAAGRQKLLIILFMVFVGSILIFKAQTFSSEQGEILSEAMDQVGK